MDIQNITAYSILALVVVFILMPLLGSLFTGNHSKYKEDFRVGFLVTLTLTVILGGAFSVLWAIDKVIGI